MSDYAALQEEIYYAYQYIAQIEGMVSGSLPDRPPQIKPRPGPPVVVDIPYVSGEGEVGAVLTCTMGNWQGTPTGYAYAWDGVGADASSPTYTVDAADAGSSIGCMVTATNSYGATDAPMSNTIAIAGAAAASASHSTSRRK